MSKRSSNVSTWFLTSVFVFAVPLLLGLLLGFTRTGYGTYLPLLASVLFWTGLVVGCWLAFYIFSAATLRILRALNMPIMVGVLIGALCAIFPVRPLIGPYAQLFRPFLLEDYTPRKLSGPELSGDFLLLFLQNWGGVLIVWLSINAFFLFILDWRGYQFTGKNTRWQTRRPSRKPPSLPS